MVFYRSVVEKLRKCSKTSLHHQCIERGNLPITTDVRGGDDRPIIWLLSLTLYISSSEWKTETLVMRSTIRKSAMNE